MSKFFIKEIILIYIITSIVINYPNVDSNIIFYIKTLSIFLIGFLFLILVFSNRNIEFFYKKSGSLLLISLLAVIVYSMVTLTKPNFLLFSIIFIMFFTFLGRYIGIGNLRLGLFSTLSLIFVDVLLLRVCLSGLFDIYNYTYYISDMSLELKKVGYNIGRTGWAISLIFLICFFKTFKKQLSDNSIFKEFLLLSAIVLGCICVFFSDSRTGIIALILLLIMWNYSFMKNLIKSKILFFMFLILEFFVVVLSIAKIAILLEGTRLSTFYSGDDISNGRSEGTAIGLEIIKNHFIIGTYPVKSYDLKEYGLEYSEIHILWLNLMALYGVPLIIFIGIILLLFVFRSAKLYYLNYSNYNVLDSKTLLFLVFFGLFATLFEPNALISFISFVAIYWFVLGLCLNDKNPRSL